jgi:hypothetical protein
MSAVPEPSPDVTASLLLPPAAPAAATTPIGGGEGWFLLTLFGLLFGAMYCSCIVCVMRGTGSMPRYLRKACCVIDG